MNAPRVRPRLGATVMVLRDGATGLEVLLMQRSSSLRFAPGAHVFPGGAVDPGDIEQATAGDPLSPARVAAVRECMEEASVSLVADHLRYVSRWITPAESPIRFDTQFFAAPMPAGQQPVPDGSELVDAAWFRPHAGLAAADRGVLELIEPTRRSLELLDRFSSVDHALTAFDFGQRRPDRIREADLGERIVIPTDPPGAAADPMEALR